jgi:hypothetical protein
MCRCDEPSFRAGIPVTRQAVAAAVPALATRCGPLPPIPRGGTHTGETLGEGSHAVRAGLRFCFHCPFLCLTVSVLAPSCPALRRHKPIPPHWRTPVGEPRSAGALNISRGLTGPLRHPCTKRFEVASSPIKRCGNPAHPRRCRHLHRRRRRLGCTRTPTLSSPPACYAGGRVRRPARLDGFARG